MSSSGRVIVIGDAAHAMPPTGGVGAAMAFEDACSLADLLGSVSCEEANILDHLTKWQTIRQQRVKQALAFTSKGGDMRKASVSSFWQLFKEWTMWLYFRWVGPEAGLSWICEYDTKAATA